MQLYEAYRRSHDLTADFRCDREHYALQDNVTRASLGLLMGRPEHVPSTAASPQAIAKLAIVNMAHCKCQGLEDTFPSSPGYKTQARNCSAFWNECGTQNLTAIRLWRPKVFVGYGVATTWWLHHVVKGSEHPQWQVTGIDLSEKASWLMKLAWLNGPDGIRIRAVFLRHPSYGLDMKRAGELFQHALEDARAICPPEDRNSLTLPL
jgi:hypothetical protein